MPRFRKPSPATVLALIALSVALGGTALAATGQLVNIADPVDGSRVARVDGGGRLLIGDGSGGITVDGRASSPVPVTGNVSATTARGTALDTRDVTTSPWQAAGYFTVDSTYGCFSLPAPPTGKKVLLRSAFAATGFPDSGISALYLSAHYNAGGFLPLIRIGFPSLGSTGSARLEDLNLVYDGTGNNAGEVPDIYICYERPSGTPTRSLNVILTGEQFTP